MAKKYAKGYKLSVLEQRMLDDDAFYAVSSEEVKKLFWKMDRLKYPRQEIQRVRTKYWDYYTDSEKELMEELGLSYSEQHISKVKKKFLINGFTVNQWKMLSVDSYFPSPRIIRQFMGECAANGDEPSLDILKKKYQTYLDDTENASAAAILQENELPPDTPYKTISKNGIDGMSFFQWKLIHQADYVPKNKSALISAWRQIENSGDYKTAAIIERKYFDIFHPEPPPPTEEALYEGEELFLKTFPNNEALRKRTENDRAKRRKKNSKESSERS